MFKVTIDGKTVDVPVGSTILQAAELAGVPLERASDLEPHATALYGIPLLLAARLGTPCSDWGAVQDCITALATASAVMPLHEAPLPSIARPAWATYSR